MITFQRTKKKGKIMQTTIILCFFFFFLTEHLKHEIFFFNFFDNTNIDVNDL